MSTEDDKAKRGPRGGKTTVSPSGNLIRKTFWLHPDEEAALRLEAFQDRRSESEIVRELLRRHYDIED